MPRHRTPAAGPTDEPGARRTIPPLQEESGATAVARGLVPRSGQPGERGTNPRATERSDGSSINPGETTDEHIPTSGDGSIALNPRDQSMLAPLLRDVIKALGDSPGGQSYQALLADVEAGMVAVDRVAQLEHFLEMGLHTGRFRARFGALGEEALIRLFHQTPGGAVIAGSVNEVNRALAAVTGQTIERLDLSAHGPGSYALAIETDRGRLTLRLEPTGVRVGDLELAI